MRYDAAVIGAGPSGSFCAENLSKKGFKTIMIDKSSFPRDKTCGGLISRKTINILGRGVFDEIDCNPVYGISLDLNGERKPVLIDQSPVGIVVKRREFDYYLVTRAQNTGVEFKENCLFEGYEKQKDCYKIYTTCGVFYAEYLMGADGVFSSVAEAGGIRNKWPRWELGMAFCTKVSKEHIKDSQTDRVEFFFPDVISGMGWCFPGSDFFNIGVGGSFLNGRLVYRAFHDFLYDKIKNKTVTQRLKIEPAFLPVGGRKRKISSDKLFLIGDAAGLVDPFSGEGIYYGLRSAQIAAEMANNGQKGENYEEKCYKIFLNEFRNSAILSIIMADKKSFLKPNQEEKFLEAIFHIMTEPPESHCYKKSLFELAKNFPAVVNFPLYWLKRLIFD
ncbi:NAD(P)/FAD-dependent oxidoreductase [Thermoanaerobacterium sp. DL9XJH110]|uniref:NAD(P)/FAD-dependent oxidoreductase n=1 Tax=Thermoanaerobacterium sp. DL9XJH110 TaxID=3386643 RepID=UPI003BB63BAD